MASDFIDPFQETNGDQQIDIVDPFADVEVFPGQEISESDPLSLWERAKGFFRNPEEERAKAEVAILHTLMYENEGLTPSRAYNLQPILLDAEKVDPRLFSQRKKITEGIQEAYKIGLINNNISASSAGLMFGESWDEIKKDIDFQAKEIPPYEKQYVPESLTGEILTSTANMLPSFLESAKQGGVGSAGGAALGALGFFGGPQVGVPAMIAGAKIGGASGAARASFILEGGAIVKTLKDKGIGDEIAKETGMIGGGLNALVESGQVFTLFSAAGVPKQAVKSTVKKVVADVVKRYGTFIALETGQEVLQEGVSIASESYAIGLSNEIEKLGIPKPTSDEIAGRLVETARASALSFVAMGVPGSMISAGRQIRSLRQAEEKAQPAAPQEEATPDPSVTIIGVEENEAGEPTHYTMADKESGSIITVPVGTSEQNIREAIAQERVPLDETADKIISGEVAVDSVIHEPMPATEMSEQDAQIIDLSGGPIDERADIMAIDDIVARENIPIETLKEHEKIANEIDANALKILQDNYKKEDQKYIKQAFKQAKKVVSEFVQFVSMDDAVKRGGLSLSEMKTVYSEETIRTLAKKRPGLFSKKGMSPDAFSTEHGYESLDEMVNDWLDTGTKSQEVAKVAKGIYQSEFEKYTEEGRSLTAWDDFMEAQEAASARVPQDPRTKPRADKKLKKVIREQTGQTDKGRMVSEREAVRKAMEFAAESARIAMKEGRTEEAAKWKEKLKEQIAQEKAKSAARVEKIMTEKQKVKRRREKIEALRDFLGLTDDDLRKISRKDIRLMSDYEFKRFSDSMYLKAMEFAETRQAKLELLDTINTRRLQKVDNYRKALSLPAISDMTKEQLERFNELLQPFEEGDIFLTQRELETVDRTDLKGIRTWREAIEALSKKTGVSVEELNKIKTSWSDKFRWDTALADRNPFFGLLVERMTKAMLAANLTAHNIETRSFELASAAEKSRGRTLLERAIPQNKEIFAYLESSDKETMAKDLTDAELEYAYFIEEYMQQALDYLMSINTLDKGVENYINHIRQSILESIKEQGIVSAAKDIFKNYEQDSAVFQILDDNTGKILPLEKHFRFAMHRTGNLAPSHNVTKAFLTYVKTFEKKRAFDAIIPELQIYAQALTPQKYTTRGLEVDRSLKEFVYEWINNKKGRQTSFGGIIKQGGPIDMALNGLRTFTTWLYIGFNPIVSAVTPLGEQMATFQALGVKAYTKGISRLKTKKGKALAKKYESLVGRSTWESIMAPGREITERLSSAMFSAFHLSTVTANKEFLLGSITDAEYNSGEISEERLAKIKLDLGRWRQDPGTSSIVGSTSFGKSFTQFKTWAVPVLRTNLQNIQKTASNFKKEGISETAKTREFKELVRLIGVSSSIYIAMAMMGSEDDEKDDSILGQMKARAYKEMFTTMQGIDPRMWVTTPIIGAWLIRFVEAAMNIIKLEEYERKPGLKGVEQMKKLVIPKILRNDDKDKPKKAGI